MSNPKGQSPNLLSPATYMAFYTIFQIMGLSLICLVFYWIVNFRGGFSFTQANIIFNWHPLLMTIGFIYLQANAILHYRSFRNQAKQNLKNQHAFIHQITLILVVIAGCAVLISHLYASPPTPNFYTLHSWVGVVTIVLFLSQGLVGLFFFLLPGVSAQTKDEILSYHVFFGIFIFVLAVATSVLGFSEKLIFALDTQYKLYPPEALLGNFIGVLCVFYGGIVVYMVTKTEFKRSPKLEYETLI